MSRHHRLVALPFITTTLFGLAACGDSAGRETGDEPGISTESGSATDSAETGETGMSSSTTGPGDGDGDGDGDQAECFNNIDCDDGVCIDGMCCGLESACGDACCGGEEVCLFDSCTLPGDPCTTAAECEEDEYCELGLGEPSPGHGRAAPPGLMCIDDLPPTGKCVEASGGLHRRQPGRSGRLRARELRVHARARLTNSTRPLEWQWGLEAPMRGED